MPRTLTAKLIQLPLGTVERDASILSNATQRNATDLVPFSIEIIIPERNRNEFVRTRGGDRSYTHHIGHAFDHSVFFHRFPRTDDQARTRATSSVHSTTALHTLLLSFVLLLANK